jgi:YD repeat-containing protein
VQYTIDANGGKTSTAYDGLGRVVGLTYPGYEPPAYSPAGYAGFNVQYLYPAVSAGGALTAPFGLEMRVWDELASTPQYRSAWAIYDGLGRTLQIQGPDQDGSNLIVADTEYNALGLVKRASRPRLVTGTGGAGQYQTPSWAANTFTSNAYDALGRLLTTTFPDGSVSTTIYNGLRTTFVDRNLHQKVQEVNAFGQLVKVEEYTGTSPSFSLYATTTYQYNSRGLLTRVTDAAGNLTTITYNALGQKTAMNDPDMGSWTYAYDPLGNLQTQTDARGCVTTLTYDSLNRLTGKTYSGPGGCDPTPDVTYTYDTGPNGLGRRTAMTDGSGSTTWEYDRLGRMVKTTQTLTGAPSPYTTEYTFDAFGRPRTQKYPDSNELLTFYYNAMGLLNRVDTDKAGQADYVSGLTYNEAGQVKNETLGNGVTQEFCYQSATLRLTAIRAYTGPAVGCGASPSNLKLHLSYQYDSGGNVTELGDATRSETTTYTYDALDRLTNVLATSGTTTAFQKAWTYDSIGNISTVNNSTSTSPLINQLTAYWKLDEASGTRYDSAGANHLASTNNVGQAAGKVNSAANFVASSSQRLSIADNAAMSVGDIDFTFSGWVYLGNKSSLRPILGKKSATESEYLLYYNNNGDRIMFGLRTGSNGNLGTVAANNYGSPPVGTWFFVVAWHDSVADTVNIQINNGPVNTASTTGAPSDSGAPFNIGFGTVSYMDGRIDGVGFWKRILTPNERAALYNGGAGCDYPFTNCPVSAAVTVSFQEGVSPSAGYAGAADAEIRQSAPTANYGSAVSLKVDGDDPGDQDVKSLLKWDISSIPPGSTVNSVSLVLNVTNGTANTYELYELKRNWVENQVTWNSYSAGNAWQTAGANGADDVGTTVLASLGTSTTGSYTINLNTSGVAVIQKWVNNPSTNNGFIISNSVSTDGLGFDSSEAATAANRPRLVINYTPPCGACVVYSYPPPGSPRPHAVTALSSGETFAYDANGNMIVRVEGGLTYQQNFDADAAP